jgi:hypothetical protein
LAHFMTPGGARMTCSLPLPDVLLRQVRDGKLQPVEPPAEFDLPVEPAPAPPVPVVEERVPVDPSTVAPPRGNAGQPEWVEFAVSQGMDREEATRLKREELKARLVLDDPAEPATAADTADSDGGT